MAHFAELDENNVVLRVVVISNDDIIDSNGVEQESQGIALCQSLFGEQTRWVQTSYNSNQRHNYASVGGTYDADADAFIGIKPYDSWVLDENFVWQPPIPIPADGISEWPGGPFVPYVWDEDTVSWVQTELPEGITFLLEPPTGEPPTEP